jgi:hypothetical protein
MSNYIQVVNCDTNAAVASLPLAARNFAFGWVQKNGFEAGQKFEISLSEIEFDHTTFELTKPLSVDLYEEDGVWYCTDEGRHFLACGTDMAKAAHSLAEDFSVYWRVIAEAPDEELDHDALALKAFMRSIVSTIKTGQ